MNQIHDYAAAHFNLVLGGNIATGCQHNKTMPIPATADDAFECIAEQYVTFILLHVCQPSHLQRSGGVASS